MATGLSLPIRADKGRAALETGEDQLRKIIMLCLADCESGNPYQDLGLDPEIVFALDDAQVKALARRRITDAFVRLKADGRAALSGSPVFATEAGTGDMTCSIKYINLETSETDEFTLVGASPFTLFRSITRRAV